MHVSVRFSDSCKCLSADKTVFSCICSLTEVHIPADGSIKAGLLAQAPTGNGGIRIYENLSIENRTVKNIRMGA